MAKENEIQFAISLKNDASATLQQFKVDAESAMKAAGASTDEYGKKTQSLTGWIKEQRTEQRQHNFLFQQGREIIGAGSIALALFGNTIGQSTAGMRQLTQGLNQGFVAFQGVNNVVGLLGGSIKALAGPWGLVISVVAGAAAAFASFSEKVDESSGKIKTFDDRIRAAKISMGEYSKALQISDEEMKIAGAIAKIEQLNQTVRDSHSEIDTRVKTGKDAWVYKVIGTPEQFREQETVIAEATARIKELTHQAYKEITPIQIVPDISMQEEWLRGLGITFGLIEKETIRTYTKVSTYTGQTAKEYLVQWDKAEKLRLELKENALNAAMDMEEQALLRYQDTAFTVFTTVGSLFGNMFAGEKDNVGQILKNIANSFITMGEAALFAASAIAAAKSIATFWTSMVKDGPLLIAGFAALEAARAVVNRFHDGGTMGAFGERIPLGADERPAILKVGETVLPTKPGESLGGGTTINNHFHFNGPIATTQAFKDIVEKGMREIGVSDVSQYFNNSRSNLSIATV